MKNAILIFTAVLTVILCGCSVKTQEHENIETAIKFELTESGLCFEEYFGIDSAYKG